MKRNLAFILIISFFLPVSFVSAQEYIIDSLKNELKSAKTDSLRMFLLTEITYQYINIDTEQARIHCEKMLKEAETTKCMFGKAEALRIAGNFYNINSDYEKAIEFYKKAGEVYSTVNTRDGNMKNWKKHSFLLIFISVSILFFLSGCSKKENNPVEPGDNNTSVNAAASITLNGGGFSNKLLSSPVSTAGYSADYKSTVVTFYVNTGADTVLAMIIFPGKTTGTFPWKGMVGDDNTGSMYWEGASLSFGHTAYKIYIPLAGGQTNITKYGNVGQSIEGTYSGKVKDAVSSTEVNVTGSFKAMRVE